MNTYQIILLCVASFVFAIYLIDRFTGRKLTLAIIQWRPTLVALTAFCDAIADVLPSSRFPTVATVLRAASAATQQAEKLYLMGELPKNERNDFAQLLIAEVLRDAGIDVTEQVQEIIDGCVAVVCMLMPHGVKPVVPEDDIPVSC
jgi:hypothetical protein